MENEITYEDAKKAKEVLLKYIEQQQIEFIDFREMEKQNTLLLLWHALKQEYF